MIPVKSSNSEVAYPAQMPLKIGISRNQPLPSRATSMVVTSDTPATTIAVVLGTSQADPSPVRPMAI